jgi:hypothetical protein
VRAVKICHDEVFSVSFTLCSGSISWSSVRAQFDIIVLARSDVIFYTAMDAHQILGMEPNTIFVPPFENRDGVNSQFAFGSAKAMKQYLTRITEVGE